MTTITRTFSIGHLNGTLKGTTKGDDTKVFIEDKLLCYVSWPDKDKFIEELNAVIDKYRI